MVLASQTAQAQSTSVFRVHPGTVADKTVDGIIPQAVITVLMGDAASCDALYGLGYETEHAYILARLSAFPTGDGLMGCYIVRNGWPDQNDACPNPRGYIDGLGFVAASPIESAGRVKHAKFFTGGHLNIEKLRFSSVGGNEAGEFTGSADIFMGVAEAGGNLLTSTYCPAR